MLIDSNLVEVFPRSAAVEALLSEVYSGMVRDEALFASVTAEKAAEAVMFAEPEPESVDARGSGGAERHGVGASSSSQSSGSRSSFAVLRDGVSRAVEAVVEVEADISALMARRARLVEETRRLALAAEELVLTASVLETGTRVQRDSLVLRSLVAELGCALRVPEASVHRLLTESEALCSGLPSTFQALDGGFISYRHVQVMVDNAQSLPEEARLTFEGAALPSAVSSTAAQFGVKARKLRERLHPESMVARRVKAAGDRCVRFEPARDGMAWLTHYLPAAVAVQIDESVDALARGLKSPEETRTHAQLRSDVLTDLILDSATLTSDPEQAGSGAITSHAPNAQRTTPDASTDQFAHDQRAGDAHEGPGCVQADDAQASDAPANDARGRDATGSTRSSVRVVGRGVRPTVIVTVPVMTLLGHTDEPGDLAGYGPIDAETARELARHAPSFIRLLTHPETGATLSVGRKRYRPPADLRTALQIEDESCRFPGCAAAAHRCELDHTHDWAAGGQTAAANLAHLCPKHHHLKHETRWKVRTGQDRTLHWTSPHGHDYTTTPARDTEPVASSGSQLTSVVREVHGERGGADTRPSSAAAGPEARTDAPF